MSKDLVIRDLRASIGDTEILKGLDLTIRQGTVHAIMGPNGSGKSTLAHIIAGHPGYEITGGEIMYKGENVLEMEPDERSKLGLFLAFQYPVAVPGLTVANFLRAAMNAHRAEEGKAAKETAIPVREFRKLLREGMDHLEMDDSFARRYLNEGFSGGEKKRLEILQMMLLKPTMAVMDETDSGLDIDALKVVSSGVNMLAGPEMGMLMITHYQRLLNYIKPNVVSVMMNGRIVREGGPELALELEEKGYDWLKEEEVSNAS
jgi:Fe-S cluster assembly ATP-binding protein